MKLGEALILRAELKKEIESLKQRAMASAIVQEGNEPPENTNELIHEVIDKFEELKKLIQAINYTSSLTDFDFGETLANALIRRSILRKVIQCYQAVVDITDNTSFKGLSRRLTRSEIKNICYINIADYRKRINNIARELRNLELQIQKVNWEVDLLGGMKEQKDKEKH